MVSFFRSRFHQAGFTPCRHLNELSRVDTREPKENLQGAELKKRDHLILRHMSNIFSTGHVLGDGRTILVEGLSVNSDYPLMISDCRHAEVHEIAASNPEKKGSRVILKTPLFYRYDELFYVGEWVSESFFIKRQSLFYRHHHVDELAPWIDRMTVELTEVDGNTVLTLLIGEGLRPIKIYGRNL